MQIPSIAKAGTLKGDGFTTTCRHQPKRTFPAQTEWVISSCKGRKAGYPQYFSNIFRLDVHLSSSYIVGFDVFDHQLDRGVAVVGVLLHRVADVERLHTLDMVVVPVHAESDGVHGDA